MNWDHKLLGLAQHYALWSKDPDHKVGCVLADQYNQVMAGGYNGPPRFVIDSWETKEEKVARTVHAEINALLFAKHDLKGATAYIYPFLPCSQCMAALIQAGITRIVVAKDEISRKWNPMITFAMADEAEIKIEVLHEFSKSKWNINNWARHRNT